MLTNYSTVKLLKRHLVAAQGQVGRQREDGGWERHPTQAESAVRRKRAIAYSETNPISPSLSCSYHLI